MSRGGKFFFFGLTFLLFFGGLLFVLGDFGKMHWLFDLVSHFQLQYFIFFLFCALVFWFANYHARAVIALVFLLATFSNLIPYLPHYNYSASRVSGVEKIEKKSPQVRVMFYNMYIANSRYEEIAEVIQVEKPDVLIITEIAQISYTNLEKLLADVYQYRYFETGFPDYFDMAIFSKLPITNFQVHYLAREKNPTLDMTVKLGTKSLRVLSAHTRSPMGKDKTEIRNEHLTALANIISGVDGALMVGGDFNITPWSVYFKDFVKTSRLIDVRVGRGLLPSWESRLLWSMRIPIDQVLVSRDVRVQNLHTGKAVGSDHLPMILDVAM